MGSIQDINFASILSGLGNHTSKNGSVSIPAYSLPAFPAAGSREETILDIPMERDDSITQIQTKTSLESFWWILNGWNILYVPNFASAQYTVIISSYFTSSTLKISIVVGNATGGVVNTPAFTVDVRAFLFVAPFNP